MRHRLPHILTRPRRPKLTSEWPLHDVSERPQPLRARPQQPSTRSQTGSVHGLDNAPRLWTNDSSLPVFALTPSIVGACLHYDKESTTLVCVNDFLVTYADRFDLTRSRASSSGAKPPATPTLLPSKGTKSEQSTKIAFSSSG